MEWWVPYAVVAAALLVSMLAPLPLSRPRSRHAGDAAASARSTFTFKALDEEDDLDAPQASGRAAPPEEEDDDDEEESYTPEPIRRSAQDRPGERLRDRPAERAPDRVLEHEGARTGAASADAPPAASRRRYSAGSVDENEPSIPLSSRRGPPGRALKPTPASRFAPAVDGRRKPVTDRPGVDAPSYFRDPTALADWPQAEVVEETVRVFLDRWGGTRTGTTFHKVEVVPGSNERAFAFLLAVEPERRGDATSILARVCVPGENADRPSRFWATKYFDHMGERFREDVAKTPQHSRGIILVREVSGDDGRGAVALDFEVPLRGDPYDDIRSDDVDQYRNLLNIMRMFA